MKIAVFGDLRFVTNPSPTGVGKHMVEMVKGLHGRTENQVCWFASRDQQGACRQMSFLPVTGFPLPWKLAEGLWTACGRPTADRWLPSVDWVYCPKNDFVPISRCKVAVTVHGAHELDPDYPRSPGWRATLDRIRRRAAYRRMLTQARVVLTVSEFLKRQISDWFRVDPRKCRVVGNGVEEVFFGSRPDPAIVSDRGRRDPYLLGVGGLNHMDGGDRMVRLAEALASGGSPLRLAIAGSQHDPELVRAAERLPNLDLLGYLPAGQLAGVMRDAVALFFPTRYETFGIPVAEAMAAGTPVVTCRSTAVPEIVGEAALFVDGDDPAACVAAVTGVAANQELRCRLVDLGRARAAKFTWRACVDRLVLALEESS